MYSNVSGANQHWLFVGEFESRLLTTCAADALIHVVESYTSNSYDGETGAEGHDHQEFREETHMQGVDQLYCGDEDETLGKYVQGRYGLPFRPLQPVNIGSEEAYTIGSVGKHTLLVQSSECVYTCIILQGVATSIIEASAHTPESAASDHVARRCDPPGDRRR